MKVTFKTEVWLWPGEMSAWHFASVPKKISEKIRKSRAGMKRRGWGSVPVTATIGETKWETSIFPDKKAGTYLLPLKASVRKKEGIFDKGTISLSLLIHG